MAVPPSPKEGLKSRMAACPGMMESGGEADGAQVNVARVGLCSAMRVRSTVDGCVALKSIEGGLQLRGA